MSARWTNFSEAELREIAAHLPPLGGEATSQKCPSCGKSRLRWYHYPSRHRRRSKVSYVWCGGCRKYFGQTTLQERWGLPDPLAEAPETRALEETDIDAYFAALDDLWEAGALPQITANRPPTP